MAPARKVMSADKPPIQDFVCNSLGFISSNDVLILFSLRHTSRTFYIPAREQDVYIVPYKKLGVQAIVAISSDLKF